MALTFDAPNENLLRELQQVQKDAFQVSDNIGRLNAVPLGFPKLAIVDLCASLAGLVNGTAEQCRVQLESARNILPRVRREFFYFDETESEHEGADDEIRFYRGMHIDNLLNLLLASVTTALEEYRLQSQVKFDDKTQPDDVGTINNTDIISSVFNISDSIGDKVLFAASELDRQKVSETKNGDILRRRLVDSANLSLAARSQVGMQPLVRRWLSAISVALRMSPALIGAAGRAIHIGTEIAQPLADWWVAFVRDHLESTIKTVRGLGDALQRIEVRLSKIGNKEEAPDIESGNIDSIKAETEVRALLLAGEKPPKKLADLVGKIDLQGTAEKNNVIPHWEYLSELSNVRDVRLTRANFSIRNDSGILENMASIRALRISAAGDISGLSRLSKLEHLSIVGGSILTLQPVQNMTNLKTLFIRSDNSVNLDPILDLKSLSYFSLHTKSDIVVPNLSPIPGLRKLIISARRLVDIFAVKGLAEIESFTVHYSGIGGLDPLADSKALTLLSIGAPALKSIKPIENLHNIERLTIYANYPNNLDVVGNLVNLKELSIQCANLSDIYFMQNLKKLERLYISSAPHMINVEPLKDLENLKQVRLHNTKITGLDRLFGVEVIQTG
ncbi:hypothetical protein EDC65_2032 [Stella humosa]|uniref:Leucine rich repeat (LRR) protein n=1 Tax=Stella humosa TaxID=94 RepID=A0A3N1MGB1_9PROT|nr:leucine-rich repeat domain-containing protein [Stella humosa]ROQ00236.1 hypothetical protein EDC65_2032 [Stella humosa]BBK30528.1 hypothetical protein STHU_11620 [Stella humosa]